MRKRILSLLFAAVMIVTMLPASALTAQAADPISQVTVRGGAFPFAGRQPEFTGYSLPSDAHYHVLEINWYNVTDYEWMVPGDIFAAGKVYELQVLFEPDPGYAFTDWTNMKGVLSDIPEGYYTTRAAMIGPQRRVNFTFRPAARFTDVTDPTVFYYDAINWAVQKGITTGWSDGTFRPMSNCNRAAIVTFLWRFAGCPTPGSIAAFPDMPPDTPQNSDFRRAISWAVEKGITTGYSDGTFRPWNTCSRAAIVTFLHRYCNQAPFYSSTVFSDMTGKTDFDNAIRWAVYCGITTGYSDGTFRPWNTCNRLAAVTFLYRLEQSAVG